ncbi:MAG: hypothetical protein OEY75_01035 [Hylemonella sp.]|nr:hypothetical protein [Hylemonella sp.]MDH5707670.1 hypothetical protein [Hylemonella sp.]
MKRKTSHLFRALALAAGFFMVSAPAMAQVYGPGTSSASLSLGVAKQFGQDYTVISGRYGSFFVDEFEASLGLEVWRGHEPEIYKLIPELRYVSSSGQTFKPYVALFLMRSFYSHTVDSHNSFGARAGVYYVLNSSAYVGVGMVHERQESCDGAGLRECQYYYPEMTLHFRF